MTTNQTRLERRLAPRHTAYVVLGGVVAALAAPFVWALTGLATGLPRTAVATSISSSRRRPPTVGVRTGSGDVSVRLPPNARYAVDSATGSGDALVRVTDEPASTSKLRIRSGSGDITVDDR